MPYENDELVSNRSPMDRVEYVDFHLTTQPDGSIEGTVVREVWDYFDGPDGSIKAELCEDYMNDDPHEAVRYKNREEMAKRAGGSRVERYGTLVVDVRLDGHDIKDEHDQNEKGLFRKSCG